MAGEFDFYKQGMNPSYNWQYNWGVSNTPSTGTVNKDLIAGYLTKYVNDNAKTNSGIGSFDFSLGKGNKGWVNNYINKWGSDKYNLLNAGISAGADLAGNLINSNGLSTTAGNVMTGIGNIAGNIPGPIGWAGKGLALLGLGVNALWGHKFNDANVAAAEKAVADRNNWQFGDYSNTASLLAGSLANKQLGNVSKSYLGKEGPFSHAVTDKMNEINNATLNANARANNSELLAYANYLNNLVRNAISNDSMGNVNMTANGGPLNMISGPMTPFGNRFFANGGFTHGGLFTNGFIEVNNGGSHELNPNLGVQYGVDPQGTPNMVEEGETILDDYVFSRRIKFPKRYKDEFALGGKIWKKSFADVSKMIAKESEERPNDPISQRSLKAMGGKLADIQEEVKAKLALDKMDPREVMAMLLQLAMLQLGGLLPLMMEDPYQQLIMAEQQPMMAANGGSIHIKPSKRGTFTAAATKHGMGVLEFASRVLANPDNYSSAMVKKANFARNAAKWHACGGKLHGYGGNLFKIGGWTNPYVARRDSSAPYELNAVNQMILHSPVMRKREAESEAIRQNMLEREAAIERANSRGTNLTKQEKRKLKTNNAKRLRTAKKVDSYNNKRRIISAINDRPEQAQLYLDDRTEEQHRIAQQAFIDNWNTILQADAENKGTEVADYMLGTLFPSTWYGAVAKSINEGSGLSGALDHFMRRDTLGYLSTTPSTEKWALEHPNWAVGINLAGDIIGPAAISRGLNLGAKAAKNIKNLKLELPQSEYLQIIRNTNPYPDAELWRNQTYRNAVRNAEEDAAELARAEKRHLNVGPVLSDGRITDPTTGNVLRVRMRDGSIRPLTQSLLSDILNRRHLSSTGNVDNDVLLIRNMSRNPTASARTSTTVRRTAGGLYSRPSRVLTDPNTGMMARMPDGTIITPRILEQYGTSNGIALTGDIDTDLRAVMNHAASRNGTNSTTINTNFDPSTGYVLNPNTGRPLTNEIGSPIRLTDLNAYLRRNHINPGRTLEENINLVLNHQNNPTTALSRLPEDKIISKDEADNFIAAGYTKDDLAANGLLVDAGGQEWYGKDYMRNLDPRSILYGRLKEATKNIFRDAETGMEGTKHWPGNNRDASGKTMWSKLIDNYLHSSNSGRLMNRLKTLSNREYPSGSILGEPEGFHTSMNSDPIYTRLLANQANKASDRAIFGPVVEWGELNLLGNIPARISNMGTKTDLLTRAWQAAGQDYKAVSDAIKRDIEAGKFTNYEEALNSSSRPRVVLEGDPTVSGWTAEESAAWNNPVKQNSNNYLRVIDAEGNIVDANKFREALPSYSDIITQHNNQIAKLNNKVINRGAAEGYSPETGMWTEGSEVGYDGLFITSKKPRDIRFGSIFAPIATGLGLNYLGNNQYEHYANGGLLNLFKVGGKPRSKYKSDNDWEQMYELSRPIYQQFVNAGIDPIVAAGVLGNIALESSFNPNASNRTHWGYVQNDKHIKDYIISNYGGYGPKLQLQFLIDGLTGNIKGSNKGRGKAIQKRFTNFLNASKGLTNPADVAALWDKHYEISGGQGMYDRRNYATRFWDRYNPQAVALVLQQPDYSQATLVSDVVPLELVDYANNFTPSLEFNPQDLLADQNLLASRNGGGKKKTTSNKTQTTTDTTTTTPLDVTQYGFKRNIKGLSDLESIYNNTKFEDNKSVANLLYHYVDNGIMDYKDAARLFYNITHNTYPGMKEGEERVAYLKNLLGLRGEGYDDTVYKKDGKGQIVLDNGLPVVDKAKSKHYDWVGPLYFNAIANTPNTFALSRGFKGNKDLRDLNYNFDDNSTVDDILDYLSYYGSTDPLVQGKFLNEFRTNEEKLARLNYERLRELNSIIPSARLRELLGNASEEDIDEAIDMGLINEDVLYDDDFVDYANVDFDKAVAVDPTSDAFKQLTPAELNVAELLYLQDKFTNDKTYTAYKEKFDKEYADDLAKRLREYDLYLTFNKNYPTWMRYAPLAFSSIATLTDALGLTNKPDLTPYQLLLALSSLQGKTPAVRYNPVFLPLEYRPINLNADLLLAQNAFASANRNINNIAGANIGAGIAGNTSALNSALANIGKIRQGISELDVANRRMVADYNNRGAYQDTMGGLEAQKINAINQQNALRFGYQALSDALRYYQSEQQAANAAKQVNLTHAVNSWANVGRENMYMNMINNNKAYDYGIGLNGNQWYKWSNPITNA